MVEGVRLERTGTGGAAFVGLCGVLDRELDTLYGERQSEGGRLNVVDGVETAVVAWAGDEAVGCGCFRRLDDERVEVKRMVVVPGWRGKGIGAAVLAELEAWAVELGHRRAVLETGRLQPEALGLYAKSGYREIENFGPYAGRPGSVCYGKSLA